MKKVVSVLVPIYNVEKYLKQCLDSICAQTYREIEIICVNDGSTDASLTILREYAAEDGRIVVVDKPNGGYGQTMNTALKHATGDYIAIVESDDFVEPDMIEKLLDTAEETGVDFVKTRYYLYTEKEETVGELFPNPVYDEAFSLQEKSPEVLMGGGNIWTGLYKRNFLIENGIWFNETPGASYQDTGFKLKTFACARSIILKQDAYYHYRVDNMSASVKSKEKVFCICDELTDTRAFLEKRMDKGGIAKYWIEPFKYYIYNWNYERISEQYKIDFWKRMILEFRDDAKNGYLREEDFPREWWENLQWYLQAPVEKGTIVIGAGVYGKRIITKLKELHIPLSAICDNSGEKQGSMLENYPIISPEQAHHEYPDAVFVIPDRPYKTEMINQLEEIGAEYVVMTV